MYSCRNFFVCALSFVFIGSFSPVFASAFVSSKYVLPYPSYMPGNKLYVVSRFVDRLKEYWSFGSIASLRYHLALADKYLVESKTLFEYEQYPLALSALAESNKHVTKLTLYIQKASQEGKEVARLKVLVGEAMVRHTGVLQQLKFDTPVDFTWVPEKAAVTSLHIHETLEAAEVVRNKVQTEMSL